MNGPYAKPGAEERGAAAEHADNAKPPFAGWVNGIFIYPESERAPGFVPPPAANATPRNCPDGRLVSEEELKNTPYYIEIPSGLPPGAVEHEGILATACGEQITAVSRQFDLQPYGGAIGIVLMPQQKGAPFSTSADRVSAITVNGMPAVKIAPLTEEGFGNSAIFILTPVGLAQVGAYDVRFDDLLAVAESIPW